MEGGTRDHYPLFDNTTDREQFSCSICDESISGSLAISRIRRHDRWGDPLRDTWYHTRGSCGGNSTSDIYELSQGSFSSSQKHDYRKAKNQQEVKNF